MGDWIVSGSRSRGGLFGLPLACILLLLAVLLPNASYANGHFINVTGDEGSTGIVRKEVRVEYFVEDGSELAIADVVKLSSAAWKSQHWVPANYGFSAAPHWFKSEKLLIGKGGGKLLLEVAYPLLDRVDMYVRVNSNSPWQRWNLGDKKPFFDRPYIARTFVVPVQVSAGDSVEVVARVEASDSMRYPLIAWQPQEFESIEHLSLLLNGVYIGLMIGVFFTNIFIFATVRDRVYLYYSAWVFVTALCILSYNGILFQYLWPRSIVWNEWCRIVFMILASGLFTSFTIKFVRHTQAASSGFRLHFLPTFLAVAIAAATAFLPLNLAVKISILIQLVGTLLCMAVVSVRARDGHAPARIFLLAFSGVLVGEALHALGMTAATHYWQSSLSFDAAPQLGSAAAVLLFSRALANRLREERRYQAAAAEMKLANETLTSAMRAEQERANSLLEVKDRLRLEAERRDRDKSRFLADAVHDLRQPLQAIGNALDPIEGAIKRGQTANAFGLVEMATRAAANMRSQLAAILDLSRLDSGGVEAELSDFDLMSLIRETMDQMRSSALSSNVDFVLDLPAGKPIFVRSDQHFLQRILTNIISNGIKYRKAPGDHRSFVRLVLKEEGRFVQLSIEDNGVGIPEGVLDSGAIFRPFFQLNNRHAEADKGVGLGLSIVSAMLALLEGHKLSITSKVGVGSSFTLRIPSSIFAPIFESIPMRDFAVDDVEVVRGKYVIMVEDDLLVLQTMVAVFSAHGVLCEAWSSLEEMELQLPLVERAPDLLLSDYRLPNDRTALDVMNLMSTHWPNVPTIILTGEALSPELGAALQGVSLCYKPMAPLDLLRRIAASASWQSEPSNFGAL